MLAGPVHVYGPETIIFIYIFSRSLVVVIASGSGSRRFGGTFGTQPGQHLALLLLVHLRQVAVVPVQQEHFRIGLCQPGLLVAG